MVFSAHENLHPDALDALLLFDCKSLTLVLVVHCSSFLVLVTAARFLPDVLLSLCIILRYDARENSHASTSHSGRKTEPVSC